jgi:hypothetical protein
LLYLGAFYFWHTHGTLTTNITLKKRIPKPFSPHRMF